MAMMRGQTRYRKLIKESIVQIREGWGEVTVFLPLIRRRGSANGSSCSMHWASHYLVIPLICERNPLSCDLSSPYLMLQGFPSSWEISNNEKKLVLSGAP